MLFIKKYACAKSIILGLEEMEAPIFLGRRMVVKVAKIQQGM
jgi:hypothetical protein